MLKIKLSDVLYITVWYTTDLNRSSKEMNLNIPLIV